MELNLIVGVDVSKMTLDIHFKPSGYWMQIPNQAGGFRLLLKELKKQMTAESRVMVVMEHTGKYSWRLEMFLRSRSVEFCKVPALEIKRSLGVIRGKNDKVDAARIANYGWMRRDTLKANQPETEGVQELQELLGLRSKLVRDRAGYMNRIKELKASGQKGHDLAIETQRSLIGIFNEKIAELEHSIRALIESNEAIRKTTDLLRSIKGIGWIVAANMICYTDNFKKFSNARKFNCYAGLAPFKHESGTSIKGRDRVSHLANKDAKTLLGLAASTAIMHDKELRAYYKNRLEKGKTKMNCLNVIRAKLVARMFAVVKRQSPYVELEMAA
jgi:transposase